MSLDGGDALRADLDKTLLIADLNKNDRSPIAVSDTDEKKAEALLSELNDTLCLHELRDDSLMNSIQEDKNGELNPRIFHTDDNSIKLYTKYSQQHDEIEKLERTIQRLSEQLKVSNQEKEASSNQIKDITRSYVLKSAEMEKRLLELDSQCRTNRERFSAQEELLRKNFNEKETKFEAQLDQITKSMEALRKDRDLAVIKYAQREKEILLLENNCKKIHQQIGQSTAEKDALLISLRGVKNEKNRLTCVLNEKENDSQCLKRKCDEMKIIVDDLNSKLNAANRHLETAEASQSEMKAELDSMSKRLKDAKEENSTMKLSYEQMIKQLQSDLDLKQSAEQLVDEQVSDCENNNPTTSEDLVTQIKDENLKLKDQVISAEAQCFEKSKQLDDLQTKIDHLVNEKITLENRISFLDDKLNHFDDLTLKHKNDVQELEILKHEISDLTLETSSLRANAENTLDLNQRLSDRNSSLRTENTSLLTRLSDIEMENAKLAAICDDLKTQLSNVKQISSTSLSNYTLEIENVNEKLHASNKRANELDLLLEDEREQGKILKKKCTASIKELKNEISLLKRRLEAFETGTASQSSHNSALDEVGEQNLQCTRSSSIDSRSPSLISLEQLNGSKSCNRLTDGEISVSDSSNTKVGYDCNQIMIEKIVRLQRMLARRTEKIEFLEEHVKQMTSELQKKSRIIQFYVLREETGNLGPTILDANKGELSNRGSGVMAKVFGAGSSKGHLNDLSQLSSDLSVQIINKLQALFEDTLLKNLTLKDNLQTLGEEISNISNENRTLKTKLNESS